MITYSANDEVSMAVDTVVRDLIQPATL